MKSFRTLSRSDSPRTHSSRSPAPRRTDSSQHATVAVIGLGYVGLPLAILAESRGHSVIGFEIDPQRRHMLEKRSAPFIDEAEQALFSHSAMRITGDESLLREADVILVCVPTPVREDHTPDLGPLIRATESIAPHLRPGTLVSIESTVNPGVCEEIVLPRLVAVSGLTPEEDFYFAHCPERINPGDTQWTTATIPRIVGANSPGSLDRAVKFYESILTGPVHPMRSIKEAEAVKMVENSFRDVNIAFVNELAMSFSRLGIDIVNVIEGASTKPFAFMAHFPGCGVGGHCIPVDPYYLIDYGRKNGFDHRFLKAAREINSAMPVHTVSRLAEALTQNGRTLSGSTVALLGLAYKRDVPDLRESPAAVIRNELLSAGAHVRAYDPLIPASSDVTTLSDALSGAHAAIIATDHHAFRGLTPDDFLRKGVRVVVDGRNCLSKEAFLSAGITYRGIGR